VNSIDEINTTIVKAWHALPSVDVFADLDVDPVQQWIYPVTSMTDPIIGDRGLQALLGANIGEAMDLVLTVLENTHFHLAAGAKNMVFYLVQFMICGAVRLSPGIIGLL